MWTQKKDIAHGCTERVRQQIGLLHVDLKTMIAQMVLERKNLEARLSAAAIVVKMGGAPAAKMVEDALKILVMNRA